METSSIPVEGWVRAFKHDPGLFDAFRAAEDPDHLALERLRRHADLRGRTVLEIGCGTGIIAACLARDAKRYLGVDAAPAMLARARRRLADRPRLALARGLAQSLPVRDRVVDLAIATWVFAHLRPAVRRVAVREAMRVLGDSPDAGLWLIENHWESELQELRGRPPGFEHAEVRPLLDEDGLEIVAEIDTEIRFATAEEALRVLGALCGSGAVERLAHRPRSRVDHRLVILHRPATTPRCRS